MKLLSRALIYGLSALVIVASVLFSSSGAHATVTPSSGPTSGGTSVTIDGLHFVQVAAGELHSLGLTSEGTVFSWGSNTSGQLGTGNNVNSTTPVPVLGVGGTGILSGVTNITAGNSYSMAVTTAGVFAWGENGQGQLGNGTTVNSTTPVQVLGVGGVGFLTGVTSVTAATYVSMAVSPDGVFSWGHNGWGQLGNGTTTASLTPVQVKGVGGTGFLTGVTSVATSSSHSLAVTSSGVYSWGYNGSGELGVGSSLVNSTTPVQVKGVGGTGFLTGVTAIASGGDFVLAATSSGVYSWGDNTLGQLGDGTTTSSSFPVQVLGVGGTGYLTGVTSLAAGAYWSQALSTSGVFTWGHNGNGQLGNGTYNASSTPIQVRGIGGSGLLSGATLIAAKGPHMLAVTPSGVVAWGYNSFGELGNGATTERTTPVLSANFVPSQITFGGSIGTGLSVSGTQWSLTTPAGVAGGAPIVATANVFGGTTAAAPATVTWDAGTFTYNAPTPSSSPSSSSSASSSPSSSSSSSASPTYPANAAVGTLSSTGVGAVGLWGMAAILSVVLGALGIVVRKKVRR